MKRKFLQDGAALFAAEGISRLLAFTVTFVLAREQGLLALAFLGLAQAITGYATVAGDAGLGTHAVRQIASGAAPGPVASGTARIQLLLSVAALVIVTPIAAYQTDWALASALAIVPISTALRVTYVLQAQLRASEIALSRIIANLVTAGFGVVAALLGAPLWVVALAYGLGATASMLFVQWRVQIPLRNSIGLPAFKFLQGQWRSHTALTGYTLIVHAYSSSLLIVSRLVADGAHLVDTSVATRVLLILVIPAQILGTLVLPRYVGRTGTRPLRDSAVAFAVGGLICSGLLVTAPLIVPLMFGPAASESVDAVRAISLQVPFAMATTVLLSIFLAAGRYVLGATLYFAGLVSQLLFAWALAPFESAAFVLAIVLSEVVLLVLLGVAMTRIAKTSKQANAAGRVQ